MSRHRVPVRPLWLLTLAGLLRVRVCAFCGALVVAEGRDQHDRVHAVQGGSR